MNADTKAPPCNLCQGKSFVLRNEQGRVQGALCSCFHCERCGGEGRVFREKENGIAYLDECGCATLKRRLRLLGDAGIPGKFAASNLDNFVPVDKTQKTAKARAADFIADFRSGKGKLPEGLVFMGPPGLGKTHLAVAILKTLILEDGVDGRFVDFFQLLSDIRHAYSEDQSEQAVIRPYIRTRLLVIDELAKGRNNEWELTVLDQFISSRYNAADKVTLFTTNFLNRAGQKPDKRGAGRLQDTQAASDSYKSERLEERIGGRIYSRMEEMSQFLIMDGGDYRHNVKAAHSRARA